MPEFEGGVVLTWQSLFAAIGATIVFVVALFKVISSSAADRAKVIKQGYDSLERVNARNENLIKAYDKKIQDLRRRVDMIYEQSYEERKKLRQRYEDELNKLYARLDNLQEEYREQLSKMQAENQSMIKKYDQEIKDLKDEICELENRLSREKQKRRKAEQRAEEAEQRLLEDV